jgi:large subunit ribosomal protein L6
MHGLHRSLLANKVCGVKEGFQKNLEIHGTGYSVTNKGNKLVLSIGFCHDVVFEIPDDIDVEIQQEAAQPDNPAKFAVKGIDKAQVGQFAANIRAVRPPEPYKGKGIRYADEHVRRKEGKAFAGME